MTVPASTIASSSSSSSQPQYTPRQRRILPWHDPSIIGSSYTLSAAAAPPLTSSALTAPTSSDGSNPNIITLTPIPTALAAFAAGEPLLVVDDLSRENEGDLIFAARDISELKMAWLIQHATGYVCVTLPTSRLAHLSIPPMLPPGANTDRHGTAYCLTVDAARGTTTGISAADRALTARELAREDATAEDFLRPGHIVPLNVRDGGVLRRGGHTEAGNDLCELAQIPGPPVSVICELVKPNDPFGRMARRDDCWAFAQEWGVAMISIEQLVEYRRGLGHQIAGSAAAANGTDGVVEGVKKLVESVGKAVNGVGIGQEGGGGEKVKEA